MGREDDFRKVLYEWKAFNAPDLVERDIGIPTDEDLIISIVGVRRSGKTYLMFQLIKRLLKNMPLNRILYINFEHERLRNLDAKDMETMLKVFYEIFMPEGRIYLFLDEIQLVNDWEKWLRRVYDSKKYHIFISGSSSKLLSKEIATSLLGRTIGYEIFPVDFPEFLRVRCFNREIRDITYLEERGKIIGMLDEYLKFGGFPEVVLKKSETIKLKLLKSYYEAIFYRDLIERYNISNPSLLDTFLKYLLSNFSSPTSMSKVYNYLKTLGFKCSKNTLINFLDYSNNVFLFFPVEIFSYKIKDRKQYPKKIYCIDTGLVNAPDLKFLENIGRLMENLIAIELLRRGKEIYYWKDQQHREVDFVVKEGLGIKQLIQVCYDISNPATRERELKAITKASNELKCKNLLIITWDTQAEEEYSGVEIKFIPLWKWLLNHSSP